MKKISYLLLLLLCSLSLTGCKDSFAWQDRVPQGYQSITYIKNHGTHALTMNTTEATHTDSLLVIKAGSDPSRQPSLRLRALTQAEVDSTYGSQQGGEYTIIPDTTFSLADGGQLTFAANQEGAVMPVSFKPASIFQLMKAHPSTKWVLALRMNSVNPKDSANTDMSDVLYVIDVKSPMLSFGHENISQTMYYKTLDVAVPLTIRNCNENKWDITCTLNQSQDAQAVADYNAAHNTSYTLLPAGSYSFNALRLPTGQLTADATLTVNRATLTSNVTYVLPLKMGTSSMGQQMQSDSAYSYVVIDVPKYGIREIKRDAWSALFCNNDNVMGGSEDNASITAIFDDNPNTFWHTGWQIPSCNSFSYKGVSGDDYDYAHTRSWHAFKGFRDANKTTFVIDLGATHNIVGVGIKQRAGSLQDFRSGDVYVSNDPSFLFKPIANGGSAADYNQPMLNNWTYLLTINAPHDSGQRWYQVARPKLNNGGIKGRMVKVAVTQSYRDQNISLAEFWVREIVSIDGEPVQ